MLVTIREMIRDASDIVCVQYGEGQYLPLDSDERTTLSAFTGLAIEVSSVKAFPLNVFLMGGSSKRLGIFPREGRVRLAGTSPKIEISDGKGHELLIFCDSSRV